jgi:hypothetical protein
MVTGEELRAVFTGMGERFSEDEMDEFLGWLGLRDGGAMSVSRFKKLPCWFEDDGVRMSQVSLLEKVQHLAQEKDGGGPSAGGGRHGSVAFGAAGPGMFVGVEAEAEDVDAYSQADC